ncbi:MAG: ABC transporter permease, partial [Chloroflexota bacterium]
MAANVATTEVTYALRPPFSERWRQGWRALKANPTALAGLVIVVALVLIAIFAPVIAPY